MNTHDLVAFVAVVETGSIVAASARLNLTQPGVTRRIQNLTSEIDSLEREQATGAGHDDRLTELKAKRTTTEEELAKLKQAETAAKLLAEKH